ncbi:MAG: hypothetical protein PHN80_06260 [Hespellia sp.]|nr:hypothetical protein [Hespellia sp.]
MKFGADGMQLNTKCVMNKKQLLQKKPGLMEGHDCVIRASVTAQMFSIDVPDRNVKIDIPLQDIVKIMNATNAKYKELREHELGTPLGTK